MNVDSLHNMKFKHDQLHDPYFRKVRAALKNKMHSTKMSDLLYVYIFWSF